MALTITARQLRTALLLSLLSLSVVSTSATAGQTDSIVLSSPNDMDGAIDSPGIRTVAILADYDEAEYIVTGTADIYNYAAHPGTPGDLVVVTADTPYVTRMIVRTPTDAADFTGTVVIEWWNSTATFDTAPAWDASAEYFARSGIVYVGVTNATSSIDYLTGGCSLLGFLPPTCDTRYASLSMTDNGQAYDMVSQIAHALKTGSSGSPLPGTFTVERVYHVGQSQQGGSMVAYASNFHFASNAGYFVQAASRARRINDDVSCDDMGAPAYPGCRAELTGTDRLVRTDLPVPVYRAMTETDVGGVLSSGSRQTDSGLFRYYEIAGATHVTVHKNVSILPGLFLQDFCVDPLNTLADGPIYGSLVYNALWRNMIEQSEFGTVPPAGLILDSTGTTIDRDMYDNALGGIRLPQMDFPIATYGPHNTLDPDLPPAFDLIGQLFCVLSGTVTDFSEGTLAALYPGEDDLTDSLEMAADALIAARFLLPEDRSIVIVGIVVVPAIGALGTTVLIGLLGGVVVKRLRDRR